MENHPEFSKLPQMGLEYGFAGPSLFYMFKFFQKKYPEEAEKVISENSDINFDDNKSLTGKFIFTKGIGGDAICERVVNLFEDILEVVVGDFALTYLPYGGIYIIGNMTLQVLDHLKKKGKFMKEYIESRPYLKSNFDKIPVFVAKNPEIGLLGGFVLTQQQLC